MQYFRIAAIAAVVVAAVMGGEARATTVTYNLTLTPQAGSSLAGTGTLTITDGPVGSGFLNVPVADITTLTISIGGFTFNLLGDISALEFNGGNLIDITAGPAVIGAASLSVNALTSVYFDNLSTGGISSDDTVSATLAATPLPAALPLFAGGLGLVGMFSRRRKQKASAIAAA
jgi:hypothetical protein